MAHKCPRCKGNDIFVFKFPGELMDPNGEIFGGMNMFLCFDFSDILRCSHCDQIFDENGKLYEESDFEPRNEDKCPHCGR